MVSLVDPMVALVDPMVAFVDPMVALLDPMVPLIDAKPPASAPILLPSLPLEPLRLLPAHPWSRRIGLQPQSPSLVVRPPSWVR